MRIKLSELRTKLEQVSAKLGLPENEAKDYTGAIIAHYEDDNFFKGFKGAHGVDDWIAKLKTSTITEKELYKSDSITHIDSDGKKPFYIIMQRFEDICESASKHGASTMTIKGEYMSALFYTVRKFADQGYVAVLSSNGGPQGTVPHGGKDDIFGTNPLAYGIPSSGDPIIFDAATSKRAWGLIGEAKKTNSKLPEDTYFDENSNYTTDPNKAVKIENFGGYKGYAINLLLEVMTSALLGGTAGKTQSKPEELGTWLYVIDPSTFGSKDAFLQQVDRLKEEITNTEPRDGFDRVLYPGQRANEHSKEISDETEIEIGDEAWTKLSTLAE